MKKITNLLVALLFFVTKIIVIMVISLIIADYVYQQRTRDIYYHLYNAYEQEYIQRENELKRRYGIYDEWQIDENWLPPEKFNI